MPKKKAGPATPPADAPPPPEPKNVWAEEGKWYHRDETESVYGPFETEEAAQWAFKSYCHSLEGWRPPARPELEALISETERAQDEVLNLEEAYKNAKARLRLLEESDLAELLTEEELNHGVRLEDGREMTFERTLHCSLPEAGKEEGFAYLLANGFDALLKRTLSLRLGMNSTETAVEFRALVVKMLPQYEVSVRVGKAPDALVAALKEMVRAAGLSIEVEEKLELPGSTLRSFVQKQGKLGKPLPKCFEVYAPMKAIMAAPLARPGAPETSSTAS